MAMCQAMHAPGWAAREEVCSIQCSVVHDSLLDCTVVSVLLCNVHYNAVCSSSVLCKARQFCVV